MILAHSWAIVIRSIRQITCCTNIIQGQMVVKIQKSTNFLQQVIRLGCLEDENFPETALRLALYKEKLIQKKWTQVPQYIPYPRQLNYSRQALLI